MGKRILICACLVGLTQFLWAQHSLHEHLSERHAQGQSSEAKPGPENYTGTPILFRETFNFTISAQDVPSNAVIFCYADIYSNGDANGEFREYSTMVATRSGTTASCSLPLLATWTLQTPTTDTITAYWGAYAEQSVQVGSYVDVIYRETEQPDISLLMPVNTQTVTNTVNITF